MIDHVSIGVASLEKSRELYAKVLFPLGLEVLLEKPETVGFGKRYPEFWLNLRPGKSDSKHDAGSHVCLRAPTTAAVDAFFAAAIEGGGASAGRPGPRPEYGKTYYAAFFIDLDGNKIEAVTFVDV
jgi:catechol 2,3-dioxygenase-like lactoylglutathione lyase family enzyme